MNDAKTELRTYYYNTLQGIELNGDVVPVYADEVNDTVAPYTRDDPPSRYIILSSQNSLDESPKCNFQERHSIQVTSFASFNAYEGSQVPAEQINNIVKQRILLDTAGAFDLPNFTVWRSRQDLSTNQAEKTKTQNLYKTITIFNHSIAEK